MSGLISREEINKDLFLQEEIVSQKLDVKPSESGQKRCDALVSIV